MERIRLTRDEKEVMGHIAANGGKQPAKISPVMFHYSLSTLREKGLADFKSNYGEVIDARLTMKGLAYVEQNPNLKNPVDWKWIITITLTGITAVATTLALFVACSVL